MLASGENPDAILETFMTDHLPGNNATGDENGPQISPAGEPKGSEPGIF